MTQVKEGSEVPKYADRDAGDGLGSRVAFVSGPAEAPSFDGGVTFVGSLEVVAV